MGRENVGIARYMSYGTLRVRNEVFSTCACIASTPDEYLSAGKAGLDIQQESV